MESYREEVVREFYTSYLASLRGSLDRRAKPVKHDPLTEVLVRGCRVDISSTSIRRILYGVSTGAARVSLNP